MHPAHDALVRRFYAAFATRDAEGMVACYHPDVAFSDPVFGSLAAPRARAMWRMLCARGTDLRVMLGPVETHATAGRAVWDARYSFGARRRRVHNRVTASFTFADDLILRHADGFDLWRWARQALGPTGLLLGWSPPVQRRIRAQALRGLANYERDHPEAGAIRA